MTMMRWPRVILVLAGSLLLLLGSCWAASRYLGSRLEVTRVTFYCDRLRLAMSSTEVERALAEVGEHSTGGEPGERQYVHFADPLTRLALGTVVLEFEEDALISLGTTGMMGDPGTMPDCPGTASP